MFGFALSLCLRVVVQPRGRTWAPAVRAPFPPMLAGMRCIKPFALFQSHATGPPSRATPSPPRPPAVCCAAPRFHLHPTDSHDCRSTILGDTTSHIPLLKLNTYSLISLNDSDTIICRSTILGDTIARTLEFCGADVLRLNHIVSAASCLEALSAPCLPWLLWLPAIGRRLAALYHSCAG